MEQRKRDDIARLRTDDISILSGTKKRAGCRGRGFIGRESRSGMSGKGLNSIMKKL